MAVETSDFSASGAGRSLPGTYPIPLVRTTLAGFIGSTERGPLNEPVTVRSFAEFFQHFGGQTNEGFVSAAVHDYFLHGGAAAVVVRVANRATRAEIRCPAADEELVFTARCPGAREILRVSIDYDGVADEAGRFNLVVQRLRRGVSTVVADQELYPGVSVDSADDRFIIDMLRDSRLLAVTGAVPTVRPDATPPLRPGDPIRYIGPSREGTDGFALTDYDVIGSRSQGTGLFAFDRGPRVDILCIPPPPGRAFGPTVLVAAERICAQRKALYIFDPPWSWESPDQAIAGARALDSTSRHVLAYYPRIRPRGDRARAGNGLPACGAIAGLLARRDARGIWRDHEELTLKTSLTVARELTRGQAALLSRAGINVFRAGRAGQTLLAGNLTLGSVRRLDRHTNRLDQSRLADFVLSSAEDAVAFALAHDAGEATLAALERRVRHFLTGLHELGAFPGSSPAQAFFVRAAAAAGSAPAALRLGVALDRPGEFIEATIPVAHDHAPVARLTAGLEAERLLF